MQFGLDGDMILMPHLDSLLKEAGFFDSTGHFQYNVRSERQCLDLYGCEPLGSA